MYFRELALYKFVLLLFIIIIIYFYYVHFKTLALLWMQQFVLFLFI